MLIGEILIEAGVLDHERVEEALEAQVIHGGRLGTNLVELGHVTEEQLAKALGKQHGIGCTFGDIVPEPEAIGVLDLNYLDDKDVLPLKVEGNRLVLLCINPNDIEARDHVSRSAGKRVVPMVVCEYRMAQLQRRFCKAFRPVRAVDVSDVKKKKQAEQQAREKTEEELMNEDDFSFLYAEAMSGGAEVAPAAPAPKKAAPQQAPMSARQAPPQRPAPQQAPRPVQQPPQVLQRPVPQQPLAPPQVPVAKRPPVAPERPFAHPPAATRPVPPPAQMILDVEPPPAEVELEAEEILEEATIVGEELPELDPLEISMVEEEPLLEGEIVQEPPQQVPTTSLAALQQEATERRENERRTAAFNLAPPDERRTVPDRRGPQELPEEPVTPLSFAEAQKALQSITNRDDIARTVLRFAVGKNARALLLTVQGDLAIGWDGAGAGISPRKIKRMGFSLKGASAFKLARDNRSHYVGPLRKEPGNLAFIKALGVKGVPKSVVIMPVLASGKVVNLLFCDNGPGELASPDIGELMILSQKVGRSYEEMIAARKKQNAARAPKAP